MSLAEQRTTGRLWELLPAALVALAALWIVHVALPTQGTNDAGLAYLGGVEAWRTGHPEWLATWISTPFLAMVMALASLVLTKIQTADVVVGLDVAVAAIAITTTWAGMRRQVSRTWWWITLGAAATFAPLASSLWWTQPSVIAFGLGLFGFWLARQDRAAFAGLAIALSVASKPVLILLPLVLWLRPEGRRAAVSTLLWGLAILGISQAFLAWRAHDLAALSPLTSYATFAHRSSPANGWVCSAENFAVQSLSCRLFGPGNWAVQNVFIYVFTTALGIGAYSVVRFHNPLSWEWFAWTALLSPMFSPIAWSHSQVLLAPMLALLAYRFATRGAPTSAWIGLVIAYLMADLVWRPYALLTTVLSIRSAPTPVEVALEMTVSLFAQFAVYGVALTWYRHYGRVTDIGSDRQF